MSAFPRPLTEKEKGLLIGILQNRKHLQKYLDQVDGLQVVGECGCGDPGCGSVYFQHYERGNSECIAHCFLEDGKYVAVFANGGKLSELEII